MLGTAARRAVPLLLLQLLDLERREQAFDLVGGVEGSASIAVTVHPSSSNAVASVPSPDPNSTTWNEPSVGKRSRTAASSGRAERPSSFR